MGGVVSIAISVAAALLLYGSGHQFLLCAAVVVALFTVWSVGTMHNFASYARRERADRLREGLHAKGTLDGPAEARLAKFECGVEPQAVPNWLAAVNMALTLAGLGLLITAFMIR